MAMAVMDDYLDSPVEPEEVFPCKGCGEILEEGKAFELAGNRWHLDCFRCNTCNTLLDSDANLLLLGDGSLICNNCTYSCSACGNKIEDLAILTGDQAFCATCFRCRNCKRKIENLRYARTSQGIFCMTCHESLMARRRKKSKAAAQKAREKESPMITEKSLPALPPHIAENPSTSFGPAELEASELSPPPSRPAYGRNDSSQSSVHPDMSPEKASDAYKETLAPPAQGYRKNRSSVIVSGDLAGGGDGDGFYIPVVLDPSPAPSVTPTPRSAADVFSDAATRTNAQNDKQDASASAPHIAFQEKLRVSSSDYESTPHELPARTLSKLKPERGAREERTVLNGKPTLNNNEFKLQDAPKSRRLVASKNSTPPSGLENGAPGQGFGGQQRAKDLVSLMKTDAASMITSESASTSRSSADSRQLDEDEGLRASPENLSDTGSQPAARKEAALGASRHAPGNAKPIMGPTIKTVPSEDLVPPPRQGPPGHKLSSTYMQPRAAPHPPAHVPKESIMSANANPARQGEDGKTSPKLPRWSAGGDFSMDEDMARILGTDEGSSSIMRRVSNAVQHGRHNSAEAGHPTTRLGHSRSVSETTRGTSSPRWPRTPAAEDPHRRGQDISSPVFLAGASQEDSALLRRQLQNSEQRVAELERKFHTENDLKTLNKKVLERRKTVSVLDTQTEIMIRQLEVLAGYVERAKKTNEMLDPRELEDSALKEFVQKLDKLKQSLAGQIEHLHAERDELMDEKNQAMADRDRALLEFEQLSSKNAQLADMNNDLTHQIQERFKQQINHNDGGKTANGLGIYSHSKGVSTASINLVDSASMQTGTTLMGTDAEEPVLEGPTVVNMRKGQVKKFNWKKGSSKVAHNITKGINRAAVAFQQQDQQRPQPHGNLTGDNIGLPYNMTVAQVELPLAVTQITSGLPARAGVDTSRQGFGFFSKKPTNNINTSNMNMNKSLSAASVSAPAIAEAPSTLFGSDLVERADFERRQIPSVVIRCIEEVELRGMDVEGIYRKTGGNSQVKMIQEGFDRNMDYDISDPALDITAVTSVLKQYFRKLPTPLLTFDVYERILDSNTMPNDMERCNHLRATVNMLPQKHRDCLEFLMFHLARVAGRERENLMSPKNLAVVFAPTIMRDHSLEKEMTDMHAKNIAVQFIIEHSHTVFSDA